MFSKIKSLVKYLSSPMPLSDYDGYDEYWEKRTQDANSPPLKRVKLVANFIEPNSTILDIGCGNGQLIEYITKNSRPKKIIGIDIASETVTSLKSDGYEAYCLDITSSEFFEFMKGRNFDYIIITEVLEHIHEPEKVMQLIKNSFNKYVIVSIPNSGYWINRLRLLFGKFPVVVIIYHVKEHIRFWTHHDFLYWSNYLGFRVIKCIPSASSQMFKLNLGKVNLSLFGMQIIYILEAKH
jgi:methionine biosynthesis protein MetW